MKNCIFCGLKKNEEEFNKEHVILDSLGGKGDDNLLKNVCTNCNSGLGSRVDSFFVNHIVTKYLRHKFKIKGKSGIVHPLANETLNYANSGIKVIPKQNKQGALTSLIAKHQVIEFDDGCTLFVSPKKGFEEFVKSKVKENCGTELSQNEILDNKLKIVNPQIPYLNDEMVLTQDNIKSFAYCSIPLLLKMAYEYSYMKLGESYLDDETAKSIKDFLMTFDAKKSLSILIPVDIKIQLDNKIKNEISLSLSKPNHKLFVSIDLFGITSSKVCISEDAEKFEFTEKGCQLKIPVG